MRWGVLRAGLNPRSQARPVRARRVQALCPTTASLLQGCPDLLTGVPFAYAFFSTLKTGTRGCGAAAGRRAGQPRVAPAAAAPNALTTPSRPPGPAPAGIAPHYGPCNIRLRVHFPLRVPAGGADAVGMRLAGETLAWREREPLVFDDTYEHSVWNEAGADRVVLLFDVWHPDLAQAERDALVGMFDDARRAGWLT